MEKIPYKIAQSRLLALSLIGKGIAPHLQLSELIGLNSRSKSCLSEV